MNLFLVTKDGRILTPELTGTILDGVTRNSIITSPETSATSGSRNAPHRRGRVAQGGERRNDLRSVLHRHRCSHHPHRHPAVGRRRGDLGSAGQTGPVTAELRKALLDIQYGRVEDAHGWRHPVTIL